MWLQLRTGAIFSKLFVQLRRLESKRAYQASWPQNIWEPSLAFRIYGNLWAKMSKEPTKQTFCNASRLCPLRMGQENTWLSLKKRLALQVWMMDGMDSMDSILFGFQNFVVATDSPGLKSQQTMPFPFHQADPCICHLHIQWVRWARVIASSQNSFLIRTIMFIIDHNCPRKFHRGNSELRKVNIGIAPKIIVSSWHVPEGEKWLKKY